MGNCLILHLVHVFRFSGGKVIDNNMAFFSWHGLLSRELLVPDTLTGASFLVTVCCPSNQQELLLLHTIVLHPNCMLSFKSTGATITPHYNGASS